MSRPDVAFDEAMSGWVSFTELDHNPALAEGRRARRRMTIRVHIEIDDLDAFAADPAHAARVGGDVVFDALGPPLDIVGGSFHLLVDAPDRRHRRMVYRLLCRDAEGAPLTVLGVKPVEDDPGLDARTDVTTLFVRLLSGHVAAGAERVEQVVATGILTLSPWQFLRQLRSMRGPRRAAFMALFVRMVEQAYDGAPPGDTSPDFLVEAPAFWGEAPGAWHAVRNRPGLERRLVPYRTDDGLTLWLHHLRLAGAPPGERGPALLVHGAGGRPNFFYQAPLRTTFAEALLQRGYDVWAQAWRGSIDDPPRRWSLDEVARYDHPAALATLARETGGAPVRVVTQCQGATSYTIATVAGLVPQVSHLLLGAVSLHPVVPRRAQLKTALLMPGMRLTTPWLDAQWGVRAPHALAGGIARTARLVRGRDCDEPACHVANFIYGSGPDCLWLHANLEHDVHHFLAREFGYCPVRFYRQIFRSERAGHLVPTGDVDGLPSSYAGAPAGPTPVMTFACGEQNHVFRPEGQRRSFEHFAAFAPGRHAHLPWPRYGHLDPWVGRDAERDVFASAIAAIER